MKTFFILAAVILVLFMFKKKNEEGLDKGLTESQLIAKYGFDAEQAAKYFRSLHPDDKYIN